MSTLRTELKHGDFIMDKKTKEVREVVYCDMHNVIVYITEPKEGVTKIPKRMVNLLYAKVNPDAVKILYEERVKKLETEEVSK